jgi:hypothetical protein
MTSLRNPEMSEDELNAVVRAGAYRSKEEKGQWIGSVY